MIFWVCSFNPYWAKTSFTSSFSFSGMFSTSSYSRFISDWKCSCAVLPAKYPPSPIAMLPATISEIPAMITTELFWTAPLNPAAKAKGTVNPSDIPITISEMKTELPKCFSLCTSLSTAILFIFKEFCSTQSVYSYRRAFDSKELLPSKCCWSSFCFGFFKNQIQYVFILQLTPLVDN